jgi:DNA-binding NarL/FixJ family response regulator
MPEGDNPSRPKRILIVEDEFIIALAAEQALLEEGFEVVGVAASFEEAVALAEKTKPDLVMMDIRLTSQRDGIDAAIEIRRSLGIGSLFTSANQDPNNVARAAPANPEGWLPKPYSSERLIQKVQEVLSTQW